MERNGEASMKGKLSICPTPIGNLEDITLRVINTLKAVDLVAAEDTRHSLKLLNHYQIQKPLTSYYEHNKDTKGLVLVEKMNNGEHIALVSDAGTPGISDPGTDLVKLCIENDIPVEVLPGPTAITTALAASGLSTDKFTFEGFLDRDKKNRKKRLELIANEDRTLVFYESPHRITAMLKDLREVLGNRRMVVARELTKLHEEIRRGRVEQIIEHYTNNIPRGEFVILVEGISSEDREKLGENKWDSLSIKEHLLLYIEDGMDKKDAVKRVSKERNIPKREVYEFSIDI